MCQQRGLPGHQSLVGGVLADRLSRRAALVVADLVRAAVVTVLGLMLLAGDPPLSALVALVVPLSAASGAAVPAFSALVPDLVDEDELVAATSLLGAVSPSASLGGLLLMLRSLEEPAVDVVQTA